MTAMSDRAAAAAFRAGTEDIARAVVRSREMRYEWRTVVEVLSPTVTGRGGNATVVDGAGKASAGIRWFERRPALGDLVLIEIPPPGGTRRIVAIDREVSDEVNLPVYAASAFGVTGDGSTDDTTAWNTAIAYVGAAGGGVLMGVKGGTSVCTSALNITYSRVRIDLNGGTLLRTGTSTDAVVWTHTAGPDEVAPDGAHDKIYGSGISNGIVDGGLAALYGVRITTANRITVENLTIQNVKSSTSAWCLYMDVWTVRPSGGDARDNQQCILRDLKIATTGTNGGGIKIDGSTASAANTSLNRFDNIWTSTVNGDGIFLADSDGNVLSHLRTSASGTGRGLVFGAGAGGANASRHNIVYGVQASNTEVYALAGTANSGPNFIFGNSLGNSGANPNISAGATLTYINDDGTGNFGSGGAPTGSAGGDLAGSYPNPSVAGASGTFAFSGNATADTSTGAITDLAITNVRYRWNGASAATLHGIAGGAAGRIVLFYNISATQTLTIANQSATEATTANRIIGPGGADFLLGPNQSVWLFYETNANRWRVIGPVTGTVASLASDTDGTLAANSDSRVATQKATKTYVDTGLATKPTATLDTDTTLAANSDARVASQKATKAYVDTAVTGLLDFKGTTDCSANPNYPAASKGDAYVVSVAGKIGGASGKSVAIGDWYVATADNAGGTEASVGTSWTAFEHNIADLATVATTGSASDLNSGTLPAARMPALTGDVTTSAGAVATAIAAAAVTLAKMANLAANSIMGNNTGSPATPIALTAAQVKSLLAIASTDVSGLGTAATQNTGTSGATLPFANGANTWGARQVLNPGVLNLGNKLSPAQLTASQNDYAPTGWNGTINILFLNTNGALNLTGLDATNAVDGDLVCIAMSTAAGGALTLVQESASSSANNRFRGMGAASVALSAGGSVMLLYTGNRWRILGA